MSEQIRQFYDELYPSDISIENLDQQLRIWIAQFLENSLENNAKQIEVRLFNFGSEGFDVIDDGDGIREEDFETLPECLDERARNEIYKYRSIGFKGEALYCLVKSSDVTIMSKHRESSKAWLVKYDRDG
jgi:DNA mismatch repair protein PMS2